MLWHMDHGSERRYPSAIHHGTPHLQHIPARAKLLGLGSVVVANMAHKANKDQRSPDPKGSKKNDTRGSDHGPAKVTKKKTKVPKSDRGVAPGITG